MRSDLVRMSDLRYLDWSVAQATSYPVDQMQGINHHRKAVTQDLSSYVHMSISFNKYST